MGGFLYVAGRRGDGGIAGSDLRARGSEAFSGRGLALKTTFSGDGYSVDVFDKARISVENAIEVGESDFVAATGVFWYGGQCGAAALRQLYQDFSGMPDFFGKAVGQFSVILRKAGRVWVFNDLAGTHHVFATHDRSVVSSSFIAVAKCLEERRADPQGMWEYLADGATYSGSTVLQGVERLDGEAMHVLVPEAGSVRKEVPFEPVDSELSMDEQVESIHCGLVEYTETIASQFGDSMSLALSGGYDSRHLVALLRSVGVRPYLYIYGPPDSPDVMLSKAIAAGEGFEVHHFDKTTMPVVEPAEFPAIVREKFYLHDGMGGFGAFGNGGDVYTRELRTQTAELQINGSCGEAYRNIFALPDRSMSIDAFVKARHDWADWSLFTDRFDRERYFSTIAGKILREIGVDGPRLARREVDRIYPKVRARYRVGPCVSVNNTDTYAVGPFLEASMLVPTEGIPWKRKDLGRFHAALIRRADPALAKYPSVYGHPFSGPIPWRVRLRNAALVNSVYFPNRLVRVLKSRGKTPAQLPWHLQPSYLREVVDLRSLEVSSFVHVDRIRAPSLLSRALTVELLLTNRF